MESEFRFLRHEVDSICKYGKSHSTSKTDPPWLGPEFARVGRSEAEGHPLGNVN